MRKFAARDCGCVSNGSQRGVALAPAGVINVLGQIKPWKNQWTRREPSHVLFQPPLARVSANVGAFQRWPGTHITNAALMLAGKINSDSCFRRFHPPSWIIVPTAGDLMALASELWPKWVFREKKAADFALSENGIIAGVVRQPRIFIYFGGTSLCLSGAWWHFGAFMCWGGEIELFLSNKKRVLWFNHCSDLNANL
jgi:hypothetical protein